MKKQNFLKGSLILMVSAVLAKALGALFKIPLTNMLGGVGMSYFSCAYSLFMPIYALTVTGLSTAVARMTARSAALGMYENAARVRKTALMIFSVVGLAGSAVTAVFAKPFCIYAADCPEAWLAAVMIAPSVLFGCITAVERGYYEGLSNMYPTALSQLVEGAVKMFAGLFLCSRVSENNAQIMQYFPENTDERAVAAAAGILGVTLSCAGAALFFAIAALFFRRRRIKGGERHLMSGREISRELVLTALPVGVSAVVTNLTAIIDMGTVIGCISCFGSKLSNPPSAVTADELPHFIYGSFAGIALTVFNLVPSVTNMLGKGILPSVTEAWESRNPELLRKRTVQALLTAAVIAVPAAFGLGVLSSEILHFLFPRQFDEAALCVKSLRYLMPGMVCLCISFPLFSMLQAIGRASVPLKIMLLGTLVKLGGNLLLIPLMGVDGAALSTTVCYAVILAAALWVYVRETGIALPMKPFLAVIYAGAICGASAYIVSDLLEMRGINSFFVIMASAAVGGFVYVSVLFSVREFFSASTSQNMAKSVGILRR